MSSHFSAVGFPVREMRDYWALAERAARAGSLVHASRGHRLVRWAPGGGPEIWVQTTDDGRPVAATPFFATDDVYRLAVTGSGPSDAGEEADGWVDGWLEPAEADEPYSGLFPLRVDLVNYAAVRPQEGDVLRLRMVLILHEVSLYPDAAAYAALQRAEYRPPLESFMSAAHHVLDEPPTAADATALVTGPVVEARDLVNPATGASYWWMRVGLRGVTVSVVGDPGLLPTAPRAGMILSGSGWVLGEAIPE